METIYFVMGMLSVVTLVAVAGMVMMSIKTRSLQNELAELELDLHKKIDMIERRIDQEIDRVDGLNHKQYDYTDKLYQNHEDNLNELYKYIDSRTDKMADGFSKHIAEINRQLAGK